MSAPISATMTSAVRRCTPGIVHSSSTAARERAESAPRSRPTAGRSARRGSRGARGSARRRARARRRSGPPAPRAAPAASRAAGPGPARPARRDRVVPATSASSIARPDLPSTSDGDAVELDAGVLEHLVQPVGLALTLADLRLAIARQIAQRADRLGRHEAGPQQPGLQQLAQPRGVRDVGLAAGDLLDVAGVDQQQLEARPRGSPRPASSTRRWPPSRPASPRARPASRAAPAGPAPWSETPRPARSRRRPRPGTRTHAVTCALWTSSAAGRSTIVSIAPSSSDDTTASPAGASTTNESDGRAHRHSPGFPARLPRQTITGSQAPRKNRRRQATPPASPISSARGWPQAMTTMKERAEDRASQAVTRRTPAVEQRRRGRGYANVVKWRCARSVREPSASKSKTSRTSPRASRKLPSGTCIDDAIVERDPKERLGVWSSNGWVKLRTVVWAAPHLEPMDRHGRNRRRRPRSCRRTLQVVCTTGSRRSVA